jgi:dGTPase
VLNLNIDLIEAIALGHDIGHTPFGHAGEKYISEVYHANTGRYFNHNVHSVRVLDGIFPLNITLDTLDGIITHNGEFEMHEYSPSVMPDFEAFDKMVESCYVDESNIVKIIPSTLEGCVVRVCDIIAYLGKDRQDAARAKLTSTDTSLGDASIGTINAEIINNLVVNIIENSYGKPYIKLDDKHFQALKRAKAENYEKIYNRAGKVTGTEGIVKPMMQNVYGQLLDDVRSGNTASRIFRHHILPQSQCMEGYEKTEVNQLVVDYIASMTDDYFIELHQLLFPTSDLHLCYHGYFEDIK